MAPTLHLLSGTLLGHAFEALGLPRFYVAPKIYAWTYFASSPKPGVMAQVLRVNPRIFISHNKF